MVLRSVSETVTQFFLIHRDNGIIFLAVVVDHANNIMPHSMTVQSHLAHHHIEAQIE
jgi:hypothetical protein